MLPEYHTRGKVTTKDAPFSSTVGASSSVPPKLSTIERLIGRPRPVPCPGALVVKNGIEDLPTKSAETPGPPSVRRGDASAVRSHDAVYRDRSSPPWRRRR